MARFCWINMYMIIFLHKWNCYFLFLCHETHYQELLKCFSVVILLLTIMSSMFIEVCIVSDSEGKWLWSIVKRLRDEQTSVSFFSLRHGKMNFRNQKKCLMNVEIYSFVSFVLTSDIVLVYSSNCFFFRCEKLKFAVMENWLRLMGEKTERTERQSEISEAKSVFSFAMNLLFQGTDNCVECWLLWKWEKGRIKVIDGSFTWQNKKAATEKLSQFHSFHPFNHSTSQSIIVFCDSVINNLPLVCMLGKVWII